MKQIYFFTIISLLNLNFLKAQTLVGSSATQVELSATTTVVEGDSGGTSEFSAGTLRIDVDASTITLRALGGFSIGVSSLNFSFSGGTFGTISGASLNTGASTADISGVGATFTGTTVALTGLNGKVLTASTEYVFDITFGTLNTTDFDISSKDIVLFPNPSNEFIKLSGLTKIESYYIYNIQGSEIKKGNISNDKTIDIINLTNGLYFLKFNNRNVIKFIKE